jgi:hypothetical protein
VDAALRHALAYAKAGWPVFWCMPGTKVPPKGSNGFYDATTDPAVIRKWWERYPDRNIGIRTGAPGPDVLDIDIKADGDGYGALARLKRAGLTGHAQALVRTRSGGLHCYFTGSAQGCGTLHRHHLDFRASGGYVLAPPSFVEADDRGPAGPYQLLDFRSSTGTLDWQAVRQLLEPPRETPCAPRAVPRAGDGSSLIAYVARMTTPGDRHGPLLWAAFRARDDGLLDDALAAGLVAASVSAGHDERDAWSTVRSVQRRAAA